MDKFLGLKLCPNHIGWAVVGKDGEKNRSVIEKGVLSFEPAYLNESGKEVSVAARRSEARRMRRGHFRDRQRKVRLLRLLKTRGYCPAVPDAQLDAWLKRKEFPEFPEFREWFKTDEKANRNPYRDRYECLTRKLDLEHSERDRYMLGRALYHINLRRGFLSNRLDTTPAKESGEVWTGINELDKAIHDAGCEYLGEYFYKIYGTEAIRRRYTERERHYVKELRAICEKQELSKDFADALYHEIFFQRRGRNSNNLIGRCKFEKDKTRCPVSRPEFEEFRALCLVNNIKVARPGEKEMIPLSPEEKALIMPKFYRKSKPTFKFSEIAVTLAGKKAAIVYSGQERESLDSWRFNYRNDTTVHGCPVTASLRDIFGFDWIEGVRERYTRTGRKGGEKTDLELVNDIWHVLHEFTEDKYVEPWAVDNLGLEKKDAGAFSRIRLERKKYGNLSLKAICKILPYLREGYRYDQAVMLANAAAVFKSDVRQEVLDRGVKIIKDVVLNYEPNPDITGDSKYGKIGEELCNDGIFDYDLKRLYHPSMIEVFPKVKPDGEGKVLLRSPRTDSLRNPAVERAQFRLRSLVNSLIKDGVIDKYTPVHLMLSRNLNDKNMRKAIGLYQKRNEDDREMYRAAIQEYYEAQGVNRIPSEDEILKYQLWEEQKHIDIYTGKEIGIADFLGPDSCYDIEHTFPRSRGGDDSLENKTLCNWRFNQHVKGMCIPSELGNYDEIMNVITTLGWKKRIESLEKDIQKQKENSRTAALPEDKDRAVVRRHLDELELRYWKGKLWRFEAGGVPEKLSGRIDVEVAYISKYAKSYLESVFDDVFVEKRETLESFRRMWGLPAFHNERNIESYGESCVDAAVIACITGKEYSQWTRYKEEFDKFLFEDGRKPDPLRKPWPTFTEDMKGLSASIISSYQHGNGLFKKTYKRLRKNGKLVKWDDDSYKHVAGDAVRGSLNKESFYGAIRHDGEIRYVIRKPLSSLDEKGIENIVDDGLRGYVKQLVAKHGLKALKEDSGVEWDGYKRPRAVRVFCTMVKNPLSLKKQAYSSRYDYKNDYHVMNDRDGNYAMALYEGEDERGKSKFRMKLLSNLEAVRIRKETGGRLFPYVDSDGYRLKNILRNGMYVLFYEKDPDEIYGCSDEELSRRLHRVTGLFQMNGSGAVMFVHHLEARTATALGVANGAWTSKSEYRGRFQVAASQVKCLVEGKDFRISVTGRIEFFRR